MTQYTHTVDVFAGNKRFLLDGEGVFISIDQYDDVDISETYRVEDGMFHAFLSETQVSTDFPWEIFDTGDLLESDVELEITSVKNTRTDSRQEFIHGAFDWLPEFSSFFLECDGDVYRCTPATRLSSDARNRDPLFDTWKINEDELVVQNIESELAQVFGHQVIRNRIDSGNLTPVAPIET